MVGQGGGGSLGATRTLRGYRPDVQVLRGIAVLAVVLYHAGLLRGGFVGVDVFFVISGFVIGRVLLAEYVERGAISLWGFYARRIRRLLPALAVMLTSVVLVSPWLAPFHSVRATAHTAVATMLFGANAFLYRAVGYFEPAAYLNPLLHTWSLSVEEQFYLAIPALIVLTLLLRKAKLSPVVRLMLLIGVLAGISLSLSVVLSTGLRVPGIRETARFAFYAPLTRAWEFLLGFALVLVPDQFMPVGNWRPMFSGVGVVGMGCSVVLLSKDMAFPGWIALLPVLSTVALIASKALDPASPGIGWTLLKPLERLGDLSYSWYLWHWPLIVFASAYWANVPWVPLAAGVASLLPAWLSFRYVENPIRRRTAGFRVAPFGIALACLLITVPATLFSQRVVARRATPAAAASFTNHIDVLQGCDSPVPLGERDSATCAWGDSPNPELVVLVGDSNADQFSESVIGAGQKLGASVTIATMSSCPFVDLPAAALPGSRPGACHHFVGSTVDYLTKHAPAVVIIGMSGEYLSSLKRESVMRGLSDVTARLHRAGSSVVLLAVVPKPDDIGSSWTPEKCSIMGWEKRPGSCLLAPFAKEPGWRVPMNEIIQAVATRTGAKVWRYGDLVCPQAICTPTRDGVPVWRNSGHLSVPFDRRLVDRTAQYLQPLLRVDRQAASTDQRAMPQ